MSPDQIAISQLEISKLQAWLTGLAIFLGPLAGVLYARWDRIKQDIRRDRKNLFQTLIEERGLECSEQRANALNRIYVVFDGCSDVLLNWNNYYQLVHTIPLPSDQMLSHAWFQMLESMAKSLGYRKIKFIELDKFYFPSSQFERHQFEKAKDAFYAAMMKRYLQSDEGNIK